MNCIASFPVGHCRLTQRVAGHQNVSKDLPMRLHKTRGCNSKYIDFGLRFQAPGCRTVVAYTGLGPEVNLSESSSARFVDPCDVYGYRGRSRNLRGVDVGSKLSFE